MEPCPKCKTGRMGVEDGDLVCINCGHHINLKRYRRSQNEVSLAEKEKVRAPLASPRGDERYPGQARIRDEALTRRYASSNGRDRQMVQGKR